MRNTYSRKALGRPEVFFAADLCGQHRNGIPMGPLQFDCIISSKVTSHTLSLSPRGNIFIFSQKYEGYDSFTHLVNKSAFVELFICAYSENRRTDTGSKAKTQTFTKRIGNVIGGS